MSNGTRVYLRAFQPVDLDRFIAWHTSEENRRFKWDGILTDDEARNSFNEILECRAAGQPTYQAVVRRHDQELVGQVGIFFSRDDNDCALAYLIDSAFWGHGYATEAARLAINEHLGLHPEHLVCAVIPDGHVASERVASKLGMMPASRSVRAGVAVRRWELNAHKRTYPH